MNKEYAEYLLKKTRQDYNLIAENFARTRAFIPEDLKGLAKYTIPGEKVLDSGCGSGRFYEVLKNVDYYGVDISEGLIIIAQKLYPKGKFKAANALNPPFPDNFFDKVFSISVLHNISSKEFRARYLKEIKRILKPGGYLILRVWDFWKREAGFKLFLKYTLLKLLNKSRLDFRDVFVPWKDSKGKILVQRYFHCFGKRELESLVNEAGFKIKEIWRAGKNPRTNLYIVAEK